MKYCSKCTLSDKLFSVTIDDDGVCNFCKTQTYTSDYKKPQDLGLKTNGKNYDIVLAYSGGKDSTYTLYLLKEKYKLNVLAVTFDNGFLAEETYSNIRNVCASLNADSLIIAPSTKKINAIYKYSNEDESLPKKSLERASAICTYCIGLVKMYVYKEAILRKIPYITFGFTPGQININKQVVKLDYRTLKSNFAGIKGNIIKEFGESYSSILLMDDLVDENKDNIPALFYPFMNDNYNENQILDKISEFGWVKPTDTDGNSTNCLMNAYAIHKHKEKYGFHPYALELAHLVRSNSMDREEALSRIMEDDNKEIIKYVEQKLNNC
ncbi:7-cyano-7-deazaguanine synthase [Bacillus thuringiensis]|uniref:Uncharacterized protein n=4 Tax=Bacillus cereus group TaxID=86661 RepID=A0A9W5K2D5_BACC8|nr:MULTISPECIES: 7-cyano-7-deazaguanine synthase [Bacillus]EAO54836.1 LPS biosynthesis protein WbpG [Bacillus thuringiensis serovar israelensis ATCC 35646]MED1157981.1 7-cyano-7-deazaguanine synthase [Bacillus paranthracis]AJH03360.1 PP-loop family protein [Bacillus thuringiensis HD1002]APF32643.1 hypothetical protein ATN07_29510 [Bacillus thuringiensis serovar israelensis]EEM98796.1 LPS biosynthesis protein WbpG [Bacillus thuringiensis IBL 4222]